MANPRVKKPVKTLAERLKAIRRRPLSQEGIDKLNRIFDEVEKSNSAKSESPKKRIARSPETEL